MAPLHSAQDRITLSQVEGTLWRILDEGGFVHFHVQA